MLIYRLSWRSDIAGLLFSVYVINSHARMRSSSPLDVLHVFMSKVFVLRDLSKIQHLLWVKPNSLQFCSGCLKSGDKRKWPKHRLIPGSCHVWTPPAVKGLDLLMEEGR